MDFTKEQYADLMISVLSAHYPVILFTSLLSCILTLSFYFFFKWLYRFLKKSSRYAEVKKQPHERNFYHIG